MWIIDDFAVLPPDWLQQDVDKRFAYIVALPLAGFAYAIREGGFCMEVIRTFNLFRLAGIKQLGFLRPPYKTLNVAVSESSRFTHSLDVMAIATLIGHNLGLSPAEMATLRLAALTHDVGTPAGGDSVKLADLATLDEDDAYPHIVTRTNWHHIRDHYGVDESVLLATIRNEGLLGQILDVADKLAYIARDVFLTKHHLVAHADELEQILRAYPHISDVWDCVERDGAGIYFADAKRLAAFLRVRVFMFRELYYHPIARRGEYLISRLIAKDLLRLGVLTPDALRRMVDEDLMAVFRVLSGSPYQFDTYLYSTRVRTFTTLAKAAAFAESVRENGGVALVDDNRPQIKTATHLRVRHGEIIAPLSEAEPDLCVKINRMAQKSPLVHVYYHRPLAVITTIETKAMCAVMLRKTAC